MTWLVPMDFLVSYDVSIFTLALKLLKKTVKEISGVKTNLSYRVIIALTLTALNILLMFFSA